MDNVLNLLIPFAGNLVSCLVLVLGIYHVISKRRDYVFSFILVSSAVYLLCNLLMAVEIDLAFALGRQSDLHTIALDFDLRRPSLANALGQTPRHNMADVIEGRVPFADHALRHGDNVIFGLNHEAARNPSELLQSNRTADLLESLERAYTPDFILFDMPPLLATDDSFGFLRQVDTALIVVEAERTPISQVDVIERQVAEITNVMGVILNKCNYADGLYGSEYGYY